MSEYEIYVLIVDYLCVVLLIVIVYYFVNEGN